MFGFFTRRSKKAAAAAEPQPADAPVEALAEPPLAEPPLAQPPLAEPPLAEPVSLDRTPDQAAPAPASPSASTPAEATPAGPDGETAIAPPSAIADRTTGTVAPAADRPAPDAAEAPVPTLADVLMGRARAPARQPPSTPPTGLPTAPATIPPAATPSAPSPVAPMPEPAAPSATGPTPAPLASPAAPLPAAMPTPRPPARRERAAPVRSSVPAEAERPAARARSVSGTVAPAASDAMLETGAAAAARSGWFDRLRQGLSRSRGNLAQLFTGTRVDEALFEDIETALIASDAGVTTTEHLMRQLRDKARRDRITDAGGLRRVLKEALVDLLQPLERPVDLDRARPLVMMIAGVNGAGKTTSIGKLARHLRAIDQSVLLAAGDTFRAAAREQLARWGERNDVQVIASSGGDPAAVAFDAVKAGIARGTDVVIIDTAGRLPTQTHLMDELRKVRRVVGKAQDGAPHEVLLVLDGNTGQNMLAQVKAFDDAVQLTGLVVTKLDGTAKGGAIAALAHTRRERPIPVYFIGVGEGAEDLEAFSAREFASALID